MNTTLSIFGLEIRKKQRRLSMEGCLALLQRQNYVPISVLDVGAAYGSWTMQCNKFFPNATYLLIEPLKEYLDSLQQVKKITGNTSIAFCGASNENFTKSIYVHRDLVGSSMKKELEEHNQSRSETRMIQCKKIDTLCEEHQLKPPYLIKVDAQGAELEILEGAQLVLEQTTAIILEVSLLSSFMGGDELDEVVAWMKNHGFVAYDFCGINYRPLDGSLSQVDVLFVPEFSPLRQIRWYANEQQREEMDKKFEKKRE